MNLDNSRRTKTTKRMLRTKRVTRLRRQRGRRRQGKGTCGTTESHWPLDRSQSRKCDVWCCSGALCGGDEKVCMFGIFQTFKMKYFYHSLFNFHHLFVMYSLIDNWKWKWKWVLEMISILFAFTDRILFFMFLLFIFPELIKK